MVMRMMWGPIRRCASLGEGFFHHLQSDVRDLEAIMQLRVGEFQKGVIGLPLRQYQMRCQRDV